MKKSIKPLLIIILIFLSSFSFASTNGVIVRNINLAGIIVDAQNLMPIESVKIYDSENNVLGSTDKNGYFNIRVNYSESGPIKFKLKVRKQGFQDLVQHENWGDLRGTIKNIMYFALRQQDSKTTEFSNLLINSDLSYANVLKNFEKVKEQKEFEVKLANAKAGNENVLVSVDGKFYIVDDDGWIELYTDKLLVSLNDKQILPAYKLNSVIKRRNVKKMTPIELNDAKFAIYTK